MVPFLVLLPFVETNDLGGQSTMSLVYQLGPTALKTLGSLAALLVVGRLVMRRLFELVAESRSDETFISLCLLTVTGAGLLTQKLGLSDTLGLPLTQSDSVYYLHQHFYARPALQPHIIAASTRRCVVSLLCCVWIYFSPVALPSFLTSCLQISSSLSAYQLPMINIIWAPCQCNCL